MPLLILPFHGILPAFAGSPVHCGPRSAVLGRATVGTGLFLGADAVVRADGETVTIGDDVHLGVRATVHIVHELLPTRIGRNVTVGANSIVHACTVEDDCVLENDVVVLDGAHVEAGALLEACSTVFPRKRLAGGWVYAGSPAKPVRELKEGELAARAAALRARDDAAGITGADGEAGDDVFVAVTARGRGRLDFAAGASLFFSCLVGEGALRVGADSNVQDNTVVLPDGSETVIGRCVTVGHNVQMGAVTIGDHALIGMGARLADGARVEGDAMLAAGSIVEVGQGRESGWLWGGRPAKAMSRLDDARRAGMRENVEQYCGYARTFRALQRPNGE